MSTYSKTTQEANLSGPSQAEEHIAWYLWHGFFHHTIKVPDVLPLACLVCDHPTLVIHEVAWEQATGIALLGCLQCGQRKPWLLAREPGLIRSWQQVLRPNQNSMPGFLIRALNHLMAHGLPEIPNYPSPFTPIWTVNQALADGRASRLMKVALSHWHTSDFPTFWVTDGLIAQMQCLPFQANLGRFLPSFGGACFLFQQDLLHTPKGRSCTYMVTCLLEHGAYPVDGQLLYVDHPRFVVFTSDGQTAHVAELTLGEGALNPFGVSPFVLRLMQLALNLDWFGLDHAYLHLGMDRGAANWIRPAQEAE